MDESHRNWHRVGTRDEIAARKLRRARVGAHWVALHVWNDRVWAVQDECPHRQATLGNGVVDDAGYVACPEHGWEYHLPTGQGRESWEGCLRTFAVDERAGGEVFVAEPPPPAPPTTAPRLPTVS